MPAAIPQAPVLGPGLDAVAETSTSRRLNFELEEGKKGLNAVNVKVDGPLASQPEPDGGPRVVIQAKGAITDPCLDGPCDSGPEVIESSNEPSNPTIKGRRLNYETEEGRKGLNAVNVEVARSQPEPDGGPRTVIQAKGAIIIEDHLIMAKGKQPEDAGKCRGWFWPFLKYVWHELKCYDDPTNSG